MSLHFKSPQMTLPPSPSAMPYLAIIDGLPPKYFPLHEGRWIAGRSPECDFLLSQLEISRKHAAFTWDGKSCRIEDVDSSRGTWVNGQRLASAWTLAVGDEIAFAGEEAAIGADGGGEFCD